MASETHFLNELRRYRDSGRGSCKYSKRQVVAIWRKVARLSDQSVSEIITHFINADALTPPLEVWDEVIAKERINIRKRREANERAEIRAAVDAPRADLSPEDLRRWREKCQRALAGGSG